MPPASQVLHTASTHWRPGGDMTATRGPHPLPKYTSIQLWGCRVHIPILLYRPHFWDICRLQQRLVWLLPALASSATAHHSCNNRLPLGPVAEYGGRSLGGLVCHFIYSRFKHTRCEALAKSLCISPSGKLSSGPRSSRTAYYSIRGPEYYRSALPDRAVLIQEYSCSILNFRGLTEDVHVSHKKFAKQRRIVYFRSDVSCKYKFT